MGVRYGDGSYWDVTDENIKRYEKQQIANVSSTDRLLSHLPDKRPTSLVLADFPSPNLILRWGPFRSLLRASRVFWLEPVSTEFPMLCATFNFAAYSRTLRNAKWPDTIAIWFTLRLALRC